MGKDADKRAKSAQIMVWVWVAQVPIAIVLYVASLFYPWAKDLLIPYLIALSVETGIEGVLGRRNADLE